MKRKEFIQQSLVATLGLTLIPSLGFSSEIIQTFTRSQLIGKGNPDIVGGSYTSKMHKDAKEAFKKMKAAAAEAGISIEVVSAYRSFQRQKEIFEGKYNRFTKQGLSPTQAIEKIIEYSTIPGTSRHHWGTDIDIIDGGASPRPKSVLQPELFHGKGPFCKLKEWLDKNAKSFGFFEVYTDNANRKGFKYEPWHFSYAPVSVPMLQEYRKLDVKQILLEEKIKGANHFSDAFIEKYRTENILDINPKLL
ncbi:M15 family metallopeptidase [Marinirhabdus gelatinilytica]|uniref:D-alanyl-D-alanine carboxypeptidase-like protein n=1 Tax=Marinirhabdus gelatinilytica TaxID=1703343 RepID=A0A370Q8E3_9FLAO|nr:M15 family metallopeptidase [Marinirhabdus gelatinilytica]RDK84642.1 D-alanyl-D-alanine carboxypeptidase-like protein [Marinirhabdus gelatinilytica]